ncbi:MAG: YeeE/YedE family protein [Sphingomonadales bacterium]|jgi:uncharacterized membrane protein YedE/YeeE
MKRIFTAFIAGLLFSLGLSISQMVNPAKVLAFLDLAGNWDPSLVFVMGGALGVTAIGYPLVLKRSHPMFAEAFQLPTKKDLDVRLVGGSALFGVGWAMSGYCPGPAIAAVGIGGEKTWIFLATMILGMLVKRGFDKLTQNGQKAAIQA